MSGLSCTYQALWRPVLFVVCFRTERVVFGTYLICTAAFTTAVFCIGADGLPMPAQTVHELHGV